MSGFAGRGAWLIRGVCEQLPWLGLKVDLAPRPSISGATLAAILAANVAGYSRLTGADEEGTHARLQDHLRLLLDPKIAEHRGRVVKKAGDGLLGEFASVVDALRCA
jgi:class 3 adenylate cyclase